jgi:predicted dehydrogenase
MGALGEIMFLRGRYGHGGRIGYEKEWRADKLKSGGGELIDQGTHLIDLSLGFLGELKLEYAATPNYFWNKEVEDNVFMSLKNNSGGIAFLQASCTEWKNMFSLEIYGRAGKIEISGLGGSYGLETLTFHKMLPEMGTPVSQTWSFPDPDHSWALEMNEFVNDLQTGAKKSDNLDSSLEILRLIGEIYSRTNR